MDTYAQAMGKLIARARQKGVSKKKTGQTEQKEKRKTAGAY